MVVPNKCSCGCSQQTYFWLSITNFVVVVLANVVVVVLKRYRCSCSRPNKRCCGCPPQPLLWSFKQTLWLSTRNVVVVAHNKYLCGRSNKRGCPTRCWYLCSPQMSVRLSNKEIPILDLLHLITAIQISRFNSRAISVLRTVMFRCVHASL